MIRKLLKRHLPRKLIRLIRIGGPKASRIPSRWLQMPKVAHNSKLCIFVILSRVGRLMPHSVDHARAWSQAGYDVIVVVIADRTDQEIDTSSLEFADGILVRENRGFDFGAWASAIKHLGSLIYSYEALAIANDSVLGPSSEFQTMLDRVMRSKADLIGLAESLEFTPHFQSFVLFFKSNALHSRVFKRFWSSIRTGSRDYVIDKYELSMRNQFEQAGLQTEALFPAAAVGPSDMRLQPINPTVQRWQDLINSGFPYLKISVLRDASIRLNSNWQVTLAEAGFNMSQLNYHLKALEGQGIITASRISDLYDNRGDPMSLS